MLKKFRIHIHYLQKLKTTIYMQFKEKEYWGSNLSAVNHQVRAGLKIVHNQVEILFRTDVQHH